MNPTPLNGQTNLPALQILDAAELEQVEGGFDWQSVINLALQALPSIVSLL